MLQEIIGVILCQIMHDISDVGAMDLTGWKSDFFHQKTWRAPSLNWEKPIVS